MKGVKQQKYFSIREYCNNKKYPPTPHLKKIIIILSDKQKVDNILLVAGVPAINPNQAGGGNISPPIFKIIIALEPNVRLTSNQAVNSS